MINIENNNLPVVDNEQLLVIDFYAEWCGPCKQLAPIFERVEEYFKNEKVTFVKCNIENNEDTAELYGIRSLPTIVFVKRKRNIGRISGLKKFDDIKLLVENYLTPKQ